MIAAQYTQGAGFNIRAVPEPAIEPGELLLRVEACSICGTDVKIIRNGHRKLRDGQTLTLGHEFVGTIHRVGAQVKGYAVGQRVGVAPNIGCGRCEMCARGLGNMCPNYSAFGIDRDGAHAEFVRIPAAALAQGLLVSVPEAVSLTAATLAEPLSCVVNAQVGAGVRAADVVVVYGAGPMGLLHVMLASISGAQRVIAVDLHDDRLALARRVGATDAINASRQSVVEWVRQNTGGRGVDVVITAVPVPQVQQEAISILAPLGRLCLFAGWARGAAAVPLDTNPIHYKSLHVTGSTGGSVSDYTAAMKLIASGRIDVTQIVSHTFTLGELADAYAVALAGEGMKIVMLAHRPAARHLSPSNVHVAPIRAEGVRR